MLSLDRRRFLSLSAATAAFASVRTLRAIEPFFRAGAPALRLSLAAYSLRNYFKDSTSKQTPVQGEKIDLFQFIDYCADHGCAGAELTSYYFPKDVTSAYLCDIRRHAFLRGITISGSAVGNNFALPPGDTLKFQIAETKKWIDRAALLGAPHVRVFAGQGKDLDPPTARKQCLGALEECCEYAGKYGIFLGLENHGGIVAEPGDLLEVVRAVKSPWFGVNLDTGNFHTADPYASLVECAPYAVNVQIKVDLQPAGAAHPTPSDLPRLIKILRDANYQGWVALEYESGEEPYTAIPRHLAALGLLMLAPPSANPTASAELTLFDGKSLDGWKITDFGGHGEVQVENGELRLDMGNDLTGVNYTGELPRQNYEVTFQAMRLQGSDFFCGLTFPVGKECLTLVIGGWGGSVVGISSLNGQDASENETTQFVKFDSNKWYKIRLRVTDKKLQTWVDDQPMADVDLDGKSLGMRAGEIEMSMPFGLATFRTAAAYKDLKIRKL